MLREFKEKKTLRMIRNLVLAELIAYGLFMILALSADWGDAYLSLPISEYLSFTVLEFTALAAVQIALIVVVVTRSAHEEQDIKDIIRTGEHEQLEFKTSLRWDVKRDQVNKELERGVMKTIAAFLNSQGGSLVIGVDDRREVFGLESDIGSLAKQNQDGFENHFNNIFVSMIGPEFRQYVRLSFHELNSKNVCLVRVDRAFRPAYLKTDKGEDFFIRTGNATTPLKMSEVASYVASWHR